MPTALPETGAVQLQIELLRKKLLDLTTRNRMLNYRPSKRIGVTLVGEDSSCVYEILVEQGKRMSFVGKPDPPKTTPTLIDVPTGGDPVSMHRFREMAEDELNAYLTNPVVTTDQLDTKLCADDLESILQTKLRTIEREARRTNEELGINTLFLTLGTLEWRETDERSFRAPLLFVPVELKKLANGSMRMQHDGSDVGFNLPLQAKLQEFNLRLPIFDDDQPVLTYFASVESTIRSRAGWQVHRDDICLGFFNYEKYAMYVDLGGEQWPENRKPWMNSDIVALLSTGYSSPDSPINDGTQLDSVRPAQTCREVYDADSSQTLAMIRANEGLSIVLEGPPGTGKSQTITNIIAEAVAAGKTVLFVAAKREALKVVKRRLEEADLGAMCLDMHDKLTNRREFYTEIKRTMSRGVNVRSEEQKVARLEALRSLLNAHSEAVNTLLPNFGATPFEVMCRLALLPEEKPEDRECRIEFDQLRSFTEQQIEGAADIIGELQNALSSAGIPLDHPFWGCGIEFLDPALRLDLQEEILHALKSAKAAIEAIRSACDDLCIPCCATPTDIKTMRLSIDTALASPPHDGVNVDAREWIDNREQIEQAIQAVRLRSEKRAAISPLVADTFWLADLEAVTRAFELHSRKWYRFLIGEFRNARKSLIRQLGPTGPKSDGDRLQLLRTRREVREHESLIEGSDSLLKQLFGVQWQGIDSNPDVLDLLFRWISDLNSQIEQKEIPSGLLHLLTASHSYAELAPCVEKAETSTLEAMGRYRIACELLRFDHALAETESWDSLASRLAGWNENQSQLPAFISYMAVRKQVEEAGLLPVAKVADCSPLAGEQLLNQCRRSYYSGVMREAIQSRPSLRNFQRAVHEVNIREFQSLDDFKLKYNRAQVRLAHQRRLPSFENAVGNLQLLKIQCELQRQHKPIRWIMARAGEAVQRIKPVFMMSPLSVAIHLPPELPEFDLVIFDEASQIRPEDALSALARGKQCIVVGDTRQMPPTNFFDRIMDDADEIEDLDELDEASLSNLELGAEARKLESILALMSSMTLGQVRRPELRWHYRSLHPALIEPSNEMFYDGRLIVFPSPTFQQIWGRNGVVFHHDPTSVYEGGSRRRINRQEAKSVAEAVLRHVQNNPNDSLMVAAMNKPQADLIDDEVQVLERMNPVPFQHFRDLHPHEPLDVKNLENVQGDERDVVFISVTYGRDASGVIRQHFGPLLRDGGERRLNVLITRARRRCEIFSNLSANDIRLESPRPGVARLKEYLQFVETGHLDIAAPTDGDFESPFEEEVSRALVDAGFTVHHQVGSQNFRIDLAVLDPKAEGRYLLGIECDGATYHSARSARDRDKLRQRVLESRGWKLHRIWSHDWWQDRAGEIRRLLDAITSAQDGHFGDASAESDDVAAPVIEEVSRQDAPMELRKYAAAGEPGVITHFEGLGRYMESLVRTEGPIHTELLRLRIRNAAGYRHSGRHVQALVEQAIRTYGSRFKFLGDCYYADDEQLRQPRDWSTAPNKKTEFIPEAEIAVALKAVVRSSFGVAEVPGIQRAFRLMGFSRVSEPALSKGKEVLAKLLSSGGVRQENGLLFPK